MSLPSENWDDDFSPSVDANARSNIGTANKENIHTLADWAEPGPSTPTKRFLATENWDDDFEADSPRRARRAEGPVRRRSQPRIQQLRPESWDDELETPGSAPLPHRDIDPYLSSSDDDGDFGFAEQEEDKTVTARSRRAALARLPSTPPPPIPPSPVSPFLPSPRSPTASVFSSGRDSVANSYANSTTHLALGPSLSRTSASALLNQQPDAPARKERERRRLRKKSRPPRVEDGVFELMPVRDSLSEEDVLPPNLLRPSTPEGSIEHAISPDSATRAPLLSRIGSVTKWGARRKRTSTTPSETIDEDATPRPPTPPATPAKSNWFFRPSGGGVSSGSPPSVQSSRSELSHGRSLEGDREPLSLLNETPPMKLSKRKSLSFMQIKLGKGRSLPSDYDASVEESSNPDKGGPPYEPDGSRGFMGSMRRISLGGVNKRHKRTTSTTSMAGPAPGIFSLQDAPLPEKDSDVPPVPSLMPPIELHPPSPPRTMHASFSEPAPFPASGTASPARLKLAPPPSPQSASLGRTGGETVSSAPVLRRNSLGDLKIPARISQAQVSLRRDLTMVRDFATHVEQLKTLQATYRELTTRLHAILDAYVQQQSRLSSSGFFSGPRTAIMRRRSSTNPPPPPHNQLATSFYAINSRYRIPWECAELLIELGGGTPSPTSAPVASASSSAVPGRGDGANERQKNRERAITLAGDGSRPSTPTPASTNSNASASKPPSLAWRASTGRHDLSQRQLVLLKEILASPDMLHSEPPAAIQEESAPSRHWRWSAAVSSTTTLPSEESVPDGPKARRASRIGMHGLRDMLRSMKRSQLERVQAPSTTSLSTESSLGGNNVPRAVLQRRRAGTATERDYRRPASPLHVSSPTRPPRRPSLAAIFRVSRGRNTATSPDGGVGERALRARESVDEEEDWDRMDSASDLEEAASVLESDVGGVATVRGAHGRFLDAVGRSSLKASGGHATNGNGHGGRLSGLRRDASTRSMPQTLPSAQLEMTPENIGPLLENAREVQAKLSECIAEVRLLLSAHT